MIRSTFGCSGVAMGAVGGALRWVPLKKRAFVSEPEIPRRKWNILIRFEIFYLCNGCSIKNFLSTQRSGQRGRSICTTRSSLCYLIAKVADMQNVDFVKTLILALCGTKSGAAGLRLAIIVIG